MSFISAVQPLYIILGVVLAQYVSATFVLVKLAKAQLSSGAYLIWNLVIVLVFFIGSAAFLIWNAHRKHTAKAQASDGQSGSSCAGLNGDKGETAETESGETEKGQTDGGDKGGESSEENGGGSKWNI